MLLLASGALPEVCFRRYLVQDYLFLIHFARAWAGDRPSDALGEMCGARSLVAATLDVETRAAYRLLPGWGLSEAATAGDRRRRPPSYTRFALDRGLAGDRLDLEVALAPCIVGYAGIQRSASVIPRPSLNGNPYREWLELMRGRITRAWLARRQPRLTSSLRRVVGAPPRGRLHRRRPRGRFLGIGVGGES